MKVISAIVLFLFLGFSIYGQDIEIIKEKSDDKSVNLSVINHTDEEYDIKVILELEGMKLEKPLPDEIYLPASTTKYLGRLIPTSNETKYKTSIKAIPREEKTQKVRSDAAEIIFYSKNKNRKSTELRIYFDENDISYKELNIGFSDKTKKEYKMMLERSGLKGKKVKLPLIIMNGEMFYNIKNVKKFIEVNF